MNFYGEAMLDGKPVVVGTIIRAYDPEGVECGYFEVNAEGYFGLMPVYGNDPTSDEDEGAEIGDEISFTINGFPAAIEGNSKWNNMAQERVSLEAESLGTSPPSGTGSSGHSGKSSEKTVIVLTNSIDYSLAGGLFDFLIREGLHLEFHSSSAFYKYKDSRYILILGGPEAYEGVGEIAASIINSTEEDVVLKEGGALFSIKEDLWSKNQKIILAAGFNRELTQKAHTEDRWRISQIILAA